MVKSLVFSFLCLKVLRICVANWMSLAFQLHIIAVAVTCSIEVISTWFFSHGHSSTYSKFLKCHFTKFRYCSKCHLSFLNIATSLYISLHGSWYKMVVKFKAWWSAKLPHEHHEHWQINSNHGLNVPAFQELSKICKTEEISSIKCWFSWSGWFLGKV